MRHQTHYEYQIVRWFFWIHDAYLPAFILSNYAKKCSSQVAEKRLSSINSYWYIRWQHNNFTIFVKFKIQQESEGSTHAKHSQNTFNNWTELGFIVSTFSHANVIIYSVCIFVLIFQFHIIGISPCHFARTYWNNPTIFYCCWLSTEQWVLYLNFAPSLCNIS